MANITIVAATVSASQASGAVINPYIVATGQTINVGDCVAGNSLFDTGTNRPQIIQADGDAASFQTAEALGVVCQTQDWYGATTATVGKEVSVVNFGPIFLPGAALVPGAIYYVSDTAGAISDTVSGTHGWVIGQAIDKDTLFVSPRGTGSGSY